MEKISARALKRRRVHTCTTDTDISHGCVQRLRQSRRTETHWSFIEIKAIVGNEEKSLSGKEKLLKNKATHG